MKAAAQIYGVGLNCPLGKGLGSAATAYFANEHNFVKSQKGPVGADGRPLTLSCVLPYEDVRCFELRLQQLFSGAVNDLMETTSLTGDPCPLRLIVPRWLIKHAMAERLVSWIGETWPSLFTDIDLLADGDTMGAYELVRGLQAIMETPGSALFIAALDSYMDAELLDSLALSDRIYTRGTPHGLVPGEAAVIIILGSKESFPDASPIGTVRSVFNGFENEKLSAPKGIIGRGLAKPLRRAFEGFQPERFLVDLNGERWRSEDLGFALSGAQIPDQLLRDFETPLGNTGDCGAANGLVMAAFALCLPQGASEDDPLSHQQKPRAGVLSLVSTSHPEGPRCVVAIERYWKES